MFTDIKQACTERMQKSLSSLKNELSKIRTGRAHPSLLEHIMLSYYGVDTPLNQVANINVADARTLMVTPWEKPMIPEVDKAIRNSDLGLNPVAGSDGIRVPLPPLSEERRKELIKIVSKEGENCKIAVRNIRRDGNNQVKDLLKEKLISEDDERRHQDDIQKLTDKFIAEIDELIAHKETELLEI